MKCLKEILIYKGVGMAVFLETFQAYDIDMLKTLQKPILSLVFFSEKQITLNTNKNNHIGNTFPSLQCF